MNNGKFYILLFYMDFNVHRRSLQFIIICQSLLPETSPEAKVRGSNPLGRATLPIQSAHSAPSLLTLT